MSALLITLAMVLAAPDKAAPENSPAKNTARSNGGEIVIGSKSFTESVILGEVTAELAKHHKLPHSHKGDVGGTQVLWKTLLSGQIDIYPDYTGTIAQELLHDDSLKTVEQIRAKLKPLGIGITAPLGFSNNYALAVMPSLAAEHQLKSIADLQQHPDFRMGFSNEFMQRPEGWKSLSTAYKLPQTAVRGMQHALAYQSINGGQLEVIDVYTTDANIEENGLVLLDDNLKHFPAYEAVFLYREDLAEKAPGFIAELKRLEGSIDQKQMLALNVMVDSDSRSEKDAAATFLAARFNIGQAPVERSRRGRTLAMMGRIAARTVEHLWLVVWSLGLAILVAVPLGVLAAKLSPFKRFMIVGVVETIQTIPGLALLVLLASLLGAIGLPMMGELPAIIALFMYSLLPVLRNTIAGINGIPDRLTESAEVLGLSPMARLRLVELPMASPLILAGIKTTAVINVGYAALGGLIAAGGYGQTIMEGLRKFSVPLMLEGAIPAALLALAVKGLFELSERFLVPKGLRLKK